MKDTGTRGGTPGHLASPSIHLLNNTNEAVSFDVKVPDDDWVEDLGQSAVFVCKCIVHEKETVRYAKRTTRTFVEDTGWQFTCGLNSHSDSDAMIISMKEMIEIDQSIEIYIHFPDGTELHRRSRNDPWKVALGNPEE